jgi:hypothetical protein
VKNYYADILESLAKANVRFVLAGGVAVVLHGVERMTMDIDVAVDMSSDNLRRFLSVMKAQGMKPRVPVPPEFILDSQNVTRMVEEKNAIVFTFSDPDNPLKQVDMFLAPNHAYPALYENSVEMHLRDCVIRVVSMQKLLELKEGIEPRRSKDQHDIVELKKMLGVDSE